jgi:hypothetical protein
VHRMGALPPSLHVVKLTTVPRRCVGTLRFDITWREPEINVVN